MKEKPTFFPHSQMETPLYLATFLVWQKVAIWWLWAVLILLLYCKFSFSCSIVENFVYHLCGTMSRFWLSKVELLSKVVTQCASFLYLSNSSLADPHIHRKPSALTTKWQISNRCIHAKRFDENGSFSGTSHDDDDDNV